MTPRTLIVGIDASARRIGYAFIDYDSADVIGIGCLDTPKGDDLVHRREAIKEIAARANSRGDVGAVFVEDAYSGFSRAGTVQHAGAVGNVEAFLLERWPLVLVDRIGASSWRRIIGLPAKGKEPILKWARERATITIQDEADALAIATAGHVLVWQ